MAVQRREVAAVGDDHDDRGVAISRVRAADGDDGAGRRGDDRGVHRRRDVQAVVEAAPALTESGRDDPVHRPDVQLDAVERTEARAGGELRREVRVLRLGGLELLVEVRDLGRRTLLRAPRLAREVRGVLALDRILSDRRLGLANELVPLGLLRSHGGALLRDLLLQALYLELFRGGELLTLRGQTAKRPDLGRELRVLAVDEDHRLHTRGELRERAR